MPVNPGRTLLAVCLAGVVSVPAALAQHGPMREPAPAPKSIAVPADGTSVPMLDFGGRPVVEVTIDGKGPYRFILDTGAHVTVLDTTLAEELSLPAAAGVRAASPAGQAHRVVSLDDLRVGSTTLGGVIAAVMPLHQLLTGENAPRGVLSASCFPGNTVAFDFPGRTIAIAKGSLGNADGQGTFEYPADDPLPTVPVEVAGTATRVHLDTGAPGGLTLPTRFITELPLAAEPRVVGKARTPGGEAPISRAAVNGAVRVGGFTLAIGEVSFSDVAPGPVPPTGQLGIEALRDFVLTLDSQNRRFRLVRTDPAPGTAPGAR